MVSAKLQSFVQTFRNSWEEEEIERARVIGDKIRAQYSATIDQLEAQLKVALKLNAESDRFVFFAIVFYIVWI